MSHFSSRAAIDRVGFTLTELLVSATLLVSLFFLAGPLAVRTGRLWQESRYYRLGLDELSGQLDRLTSLDRDARGAAIARLVPSEPIREALPDPKLTGETLSDRHGTRLILRLAWDRPGGAKQIALVGWIDPLPDARAGPGRETNGPQPPAPKEQTP